MIALLRNYGELESQQRTFNQFPIALDLEGEVQGLRVSVSRSLMWDMASEDNINIITA